MRARATPLPWLGLFALWATLAALQCAHAGAAEATGKPPPAPAEASVKPLPAQDARKWLARIHSAAHERNYQGTLVFSADGALSSARVAHFSEGGQSYERVEVLDGRMQQIYRHNDRVLTLWPLTRVAVVEERDPRQASLRPVIEPRAEEHYEVREQGTEHVAGREAKVLLLSPRDANRYAQRLWVDSRSGLVLRADVLGARQQVLESSAFSQVEIDVKPRPQTVLQPMKHLEGYRLVRPSPQPARLDSEGWSLGAMVPGFQLSNCTRRPLDPAEGASSQPSVLQAVFSDGLTHVSMFVEPIDPARHTRSLLTQVGATQTFMQSHGDGWWVTVIGDVPAQTLKQFHQALERRR
jgi:sigma-E factor negative regulatory protein RseB